MGETWDLPAEIMDDTEQMGGFYGMTLGEMMTEFNRMLNEGEIAGENKTLYCELPLWASQIQEECEKWGIPVERLSKEIVEKMKMGQI